MDTVRNKPVLRSTKIGSVTPDNIVVRLGPEYGNEEPSEYSNSYEKAFSFCDSR